MADRGDYRWLSYSELAEARGISRDSAIRLSFRRKWERQGGNDKTARVRVPLAELGAKKPTHDTATHDDTPALSQVTAAFSSAVTSLTTRAEVAERRADRAETEVSELRQALDQARKEEQGAKAEAAAQRALLKQAAEGLTSERIARVAAEAEAERLQQDIERAKAEATESVQAAEAQAEAAENGRREAVKAAKTAEAEAEQLRKEAERAQAEAAEAQRTIETLRAADADKEAANRALAVASRIDEAQFQRLQEADRARQGLGLWGRLRMAWRGG